MTDLGPWIALASLFISIGVGVHGVLAKSRDRLTEFQETEIGVIREHARTCEDRLKRIEQELDQERAWRFWAQANLQPRTGATPPPAYSSNIEPNPGPAFTWRSRDR